jgi:hypothetical protein
MHCVCGGERVGVRHQVVRQELRMVQTTGIPELIMFYQEGQSLGTLIGIIIDNYESDREQYWSDLEEGRYLTFVDGTAQVLLGTAQELSFPPELDDFWSIYRESGEDSLLAEQIVERIEINAANEFCTDTKGMASRCLELTREVIMARPNEAVQRFLRRLARCYIVGLMPECVMLCRAVLENAIKEKFDRKGIPLPATLAGKSEVRTRIEWARKTKWLSDSASEQAWVVWKRGSKAVHDDPEATAEVLDTIRLTMAVLRELYEQ